MPNRSRVVWTLQKKILKIALAILTPLLCLLCANIQERVLYSHEYLQKVLFKITCACTRELSTHLSAL